MVAIQSIANMGNIPQGPVIKTQELINAIIDGIPDDGSKSSFVEEAIFIDNLVCRFNRYEQRRHRRPQPIKYNQNVAAPRNDRVDGSIRCFNCQQFGHF